MINTLNKLSLFVQCTLSHAVHSFPVYTALYTYISGPLQCALHLSKHTANKDSTSLALHFTAAALSMGYSQKYSNYGYTSVNVCITKRLQKMVSTASLLGAQHLGEVVQNKLASLLVVSLGKASKETPSPICKRQVAQTPRKWKPPCECRCPVQNIAKQFTFL